MSKIVKFSEHQRLIIPNGALLSKKITPAQKLFLGLVYSLCTEKGYCYASNLYFASKLGCAENTPSKWIMKLKDEDFLYVAYRQTGVKVERRVYVDYSIFSQHLQEKNIYLDHGQKKGIGPESAVAPTLFSEIDPLTPQGKTPLTPQSKTLLPDEVRPSYPVGIQYKESRKESRSILFEDLFSLFEETRSVYVDAKWMQLSEAQKNEILIFAPIYVKSIEPLYRQKLKNFIDPIKQGWKDCITHYNKIQNAKSKESGNNRDSGRARKIPSKNGGEYWINKDSDKFKGETIKANASDLEL